MFFFPWKVNNLHSCKLSNFFQVFLIFLLIGMNDHTQKVINLIQLITLYFVIFSTFNSSFLRNLRISCGSIYWYCNERYELSRLSFWKINYCCFIFVHCHCEKAVVFSFFFKSLCKIFGKKNVDESVLLYVIFGSTQSCSLKVK